MTLYIVIEIVRYSSGIRLGNPDTTGAVGAAQNSMVNVYHMHANSLEGYLPN